jgi:hypothetical protein
MVGNETIRLSRTMIVRSKQTESMYDTSLYGMAISGCLQEGLHFTLYQNPRLLVESSLIHSVRATDGRSKCGYTAHHSLLTRGSNVFASGWMAQSVNH